MTPADEALANALADALVPSPDHGAASLAAGGTRARRDAVADAVESMLRAHPRRPLVVRVGHWRPGLRLVDAVTDAVESALTAARAPGGLYEDRGSELLRSLGAWRGLREAPSQWYVPDPYVEIFLESELTVPAERDWHWMLFRPTIGARFPLADVLDLKLSTGVQAQLLDPMAEAEFGVGAVVQLRPWDLARIEQRHVTLQGLVDWFLVDLGDQNRWQLRGSMDAAFDLAGPLALTLGVRLYMQQERAQQLGIALDATAGLRLGWLGRAVGP